jgi:hypothetical protein
MKINKIKIHNFRSICDLEMECQSLVVMLGPNNHGKSNVISALEFALSTSAKPAQSDFCLFGGGNGTLWVELTFHELTEQELITFKKYLRPDSCFCVRKTARLNESGAIEVSYNGYVTEPEEWWLKGDSVTRLTSREEVQGTPLSTLVPPTGRLKKALIEENQTQYIATHAAELIFTETLETGPFLGQKNIGGGVLPDFYLIPAVRDLADETRIRTTSTFGRLLTRAVKEMAERDPRFQEIRVGLENLVRTLNRSEEGERPKQLQNLETALRTELSHWGVNVEIEIIPPIVEKIFELGTNLHIDDGVRTLAEQKGHGLQRAVIFALIKAWAEALRAGRPTEGGRTLPRASSESVFFAMEEPEIYLHPHAQRRLATAIQQISDNPDHQVFLCSHSTHFVDLDQYKNICIITKPNPQEGTRVRQCTIDLFSGEGSADRKHRFHMARWVNPDRGEMFFAKRVAFVEGETEKTALPYVAEKCQLLDPEVSVIDCGSKHNLPLYIAIANHFQIPYIVIHDEDPFPDPVPMDWSPEKAREKKRTFDLNQVIQTIVNPQLGRVEMFSPDFEGVSGVSRTQGDKKGKALAALNHLQNQAPEEIPPRLREVIKAIYNPTGQQ